MIKQLKRIDYDGTQGPTENPKISCFLLVFLIETNFGRVVLALGNSKEYFGQPYVFL